MNPPNKASGDKLIFGTIGCIGLGYSISGSKLIMFWGSSIY